MYSHNSVIYFLSLNNKNFNYWSNAHPFYVLDDRYNRAKDCILRSKMKISIYQV